MINDSSYWKDDILRNAKYLQKRILQKRWSDASFARVEQIIMLGFYSIRKLSEAKSLSDSVASISLELIAYSSKGKLVSRINSLALDRLYEMNNGSSLDKDLLFVCNQIVHSYIFLTPLNENGILPGVIFSSDRERHKALYFLDIRQIIDLFELIGNDYPTETRGKFNKDNKDYDVMSIISS